MSTNLSREQNQRIRRLKKKVYKLNYLNEELEDIIQTVSEYSQEFRDAITLWATQNNVLNIIDDIFPTLSEDEILENLNDDEFKSRPKNGKIDPWVKEIYRQIANKTHPDKVLQRKNLSDIEKNELQKNFMLANKHVEENDGPALYIIAIELGLKMKNIPDNILDYFDESIETLNKKIDKNKNSHVWYWASSSFHDRVLFIENISKKYNIDVKEKEIVSFLNIYKQ